MALWKCWQFEPALVKRCWFVHNSNHWTHVFSDTVHVKLPFAFLPFLVVLLEPMVFDLQSLLHEHAIAILPHLHVHMATLVPSVKS